jgi:eukaryotic-like serine/threonine-protein kinase
VKLPRKYIDVVPLKPGKNAAVFRARNGLLNREVFLKVYPVLPTDRLSALREPHLLEMLRHQNLTEIYGADTLNIEDGLHICLEMELITGGSFEDTIRSAAQTGRWPAVHDAIRLVSDAAAGLSHLHDNGFVHRDIKPANVMVRDRERNQGGVVSDLGLAARLDTKTGRAFATRHARLYRPPEVWRGQGYSICSDVYQLGIVLFQLLGGEVRYDLGELDDHVLRKAIEGGDFLIWESLPPHIGRPLRAILQKATQPQESKRYLNMMGFFVALNNVYPKQPNWECQRGSNRSFILERIEGASVFRLAVDEIARDIFQVERAKKKAAGFRRVGQPLRIEHGDLGRSQEFQRLISESW